MDANCNQLAANCNVFIALYIVLLYTLHSGSLHFAINTCMFHCTLQSTTVCSLHFASNTQISLHFASTYVILIAVYIQDECSLQFRHCTFECNFQVVHCTSLYTLQF